MIKKIILGIILNGLALYGVIYLLKDLHYSGGIWFFIIGGLVMGILNLIVKPILKLVTFPLHILTLGLSLIILNGVMFFLFKRTIDILVIEGISLQVPNLTLYLFAGLLFGFINWVSHLLIPN